MAMRTRFTLVSANQPAVGVDGGEDVIVRYDKKAQEVVGLTLIGVGRRMEQYIKNNP